MLVIPRDVNVKCDHEPGSREFSGLSARLADPAARATESLNAQSGPQRDRIILPGSISRVRPGLSFKGGCDGDLRC
jgi:hypothetical protein